MTVAERLAAKEAAKAEALKFRGNTTKRETKQRPTKRRPHRKQKKDSGDDDGPALPLAVFTIPTFCKAHDLSQSF